MICSTGKRCEVIAKYMLETKATVRSAAVFFGISKSTVHKDVTKVLEKENRALFEKVKELLEINKNERHVRGGEATRLKYCQRKFEEEYCETK